MNEQRIKDMVQDALDNAVLRAGHRALWRVTGSPEDWASIPDQKIPLSQGRMLAALVKLANDDESQRMLDRTWMEGEKDAALQYVTHLFDQLGIWAMTERQDLLKTGRQIINEALPPEEHI